MCLHFFISWNVQQIDIRVSYRIHVWENVDNFQKSRKKYAAREEKCLRIDEEIQASREKLIDFDTYAN